LARPEVRGTFSQPGPRRPAVVPGSARTLGRILYACGFSTIQIQLLASLLFGRESPGTAFQLARVNLQRATQNVISLRSLGSVARSRQFTALFGRRSAKRKLLFAPSTTGAPTNLGMRVLRAPARFGTFQYQAKVVVARHLCRGKVAAVPVWAQECGLTRRSSRPTTAGFVRLV
jgi:hypothetical protein